MWGHARQDDKPIFKNVSSSRKALIFLNFVKPLRPSLCINSAPTGWIGVTFYRMLLLKSVEKIQIWLKSDDIWGTLQEALRKFFFYL